MLEQEAMLACDPCGGDSEERPPLALAKDGASPMNKNAPELLRDLQRRGGF